MVKKKSDLNDFDTSARRGSMTISDAADLQRFLPTVQQSHMKGSSVAGSYKSCTDL